ncbi:MAG: aminotransferase class III-fold pyridoxal phosphate-dependent enzyme, partial [Myxococcales bacterium]
MTAGLSLEHFWMPFTANRQFKAAPRLLARASGHFYYTPEGREILDGTAGLWCVNAGHCREPIVRAIQEQAATMDFAPTFQMGHPTAFAAAEAVARITPEGMNRVFFTNSGSESADTSLKIALAYHRLRGEGQRRILIGRERGYHGTNFGGTALGGVPATRKLYGGNLVAGVDHLRSTHDLARNAFSRGQPEHGVEFADELEQRLLALHDPSNVAAVIVEPLAGSTGVLIPPKGYLQRLREICDRHGILLIFDEVITGFGRLGTPFAADFFGVKPDILNVAKAINNASVPLGAVIV